MSTHMPQPQHPQPSAPSRALRMLLMALLTLCVAISLLGGQMVACTPDTNPTDGGTDAGPTDTAGGDKPVYKTCSEDKLVGGFRIDLTKDYTGVQGQVLNGVTPQNVPEEVQADGDCRLLRNKKLFCDPSCEPGKSCNDDGTCITTPTGHDVGKVDITGLKAAVSIEPRAPIYFYTFSGTLPHPGFDPGAIIQLNAAGGQEDAFQLKVTGIDPLTVDLGGGSEIEVASGKAVALKWTAPSAASSTKIDIRLNINNHGGAASWIACRVEDTGSFDIPASLVTKLFEAGTSGYPDIQLSRRSVDSVDLKVGCAELVVNATVTVPVKVPGLTSCSEDTDCPNGKTCQADLTCSE